MAGARKKGRGREGVGREKIEEKRRQLGKEVKKQLIIYITNFYSSPKKMHMYYFTLGIKTKDAHMAGNIYQQL